MYFHGDNMYAQLIKNEKLISYNVKPDFFNITHNREILGSVLNNNGIIRKCRNKI